MEITASTTVTIDQKTQKKVCKDYLRATFRFFSDYYIENGNVMQSYSERSWTEERFVRKATLTDFALVEILKALADK